MKSLEKYNSIDTDIHDIDLEPFNSSYLTPTSKGVYNQWQMDKKDDLLVDGYFRECNITTQPLSTDITSTIASYYTKCQTKGALKRKILKLKQLRILKMRKRKETIKATSLICLLCVLVLSLLCGSDIAALIIINKYNCDAILNTQNQRLGINDFLWTGSVSHLVSVTLLLICFVVIAKKMNCVLRGQSTKRDFRHQTCILSVLMACIILISVGFISYSIIGSILYSKTLIYHQCSNVLISWVVLKFAMYIFVVPIVVYFSTGLFSTVFDDASGFIESCFLVYVTAALFVAMVGLFFSTDIAGLMVRTKNDCDLTIDGGSQFVMFGVNTFLLYGCSIHIGFVVVLFCALCVLLWRASPYNWVEEYEGCILMGVGCSVLCFVLLLLSWG
eukprot:524464_1